MESLYSSGHQEPKKAERMTSSSSQGLNQQQFKAFLEYLDCDYPDVLYFSVVRWFSRAATLNGPWNQRQEIKLLMESKLRNVTFLSDENWLNDLVFLTGITQHLTELNLKQ